LCFALVALALAGCDLGDPATGPPPTATTFIYNIKDDVAYIDLMVPHHQLAIDMARIADERAQHEEIRGLARDIIIGQQDEINRMKLWRDEILAATPGASSTPQAEDHAQMPGMDANLEMLMTTDNFDFEFLMAMIPHHQSAVDISRQALPRLKHPFLRDLASDITHTQQVEIQLMNQWLTDWFK
jgi:uncharacterized protein (DUF305 family)